MRAALAAGAFLAAATAQQDGDALASPDRVALWRADVDLLVQQIRTLHPDPFHGLPAGEFDAMADALRERLPALDDDHVAVELMRLVAALGRKGGEGHAGVFAHQRWVHLPLQLYEFADGLFVVRADAGYENLVGAEVLGFDDSPVAKVLAALDPLVSADNSMDRRAKRVRLAVIPGLLHALGLAERGDRVDLHVRLDGERTVEVEGRPFGRQRGWIGEWRFTLPSADRPRHLANRSRAFHLEHLADDGAVYVQYHQVVARDRTWGDTIAEFAERLRATVAEHPGMRVIVDVRHNGGGDNTTYRPLLAALRDPAIDRRGALFLLVGRATFSAAGNFATEVERTTEALLVGETPGGSPNQYGDARTVRFPGHPWLSARIATRYHEKAPGEQSLTLEPDVPVEFTAADYFAGRDPVLAAALAYGR